MKLGESEKLSYLFSRDLKFDFSFVELAIKYLENGDVNVLNELAAGTCGTHQKGTK